MKTAPAKPDELHPDTLARFRQHDPRAFEQIFDATSPAAFALARRICGTAPLTEAAMQNAFLDVWRSAPSYDPERGSVSTWVMCIVHSRSIDTVRRSTVHDRRRASDVHVAYASGAERSALDELLDNDLRERMRATVATLPADQRRVVEMAFAQELTQTEIAKRLVLPLGTVKCRARFGLHALRCSFDADDRPQAARSSFAGTSIE